MMWMAECKKTIFINHKYTPGKTTWHMVSNKVFLRIITKVTEIFNKLMRVSLQIALIGGLIITIIAGITNSLVLWLHVDFQMILLCRLIITLAGKSPFHDDELRPGWQPRRILFKTELKVFPVSRLHKWALLRKNCLKRWDHLTGLWCDIRKCSRSHHPTFHFSWQVIFPCSGDGWTRDLGVSKLFTPLL